MDSAMCHRSVIPPRKTWLHGIQTNVTLLYTISMRQGQVSSVGSDFVAGFDTLSGDYG